ncbi:hypothetical protein Rsub_02091 [Raphidocelis subcapitata]|uniref:Uncharacterized protein n=1 Tax=Raphidocelis subcapitata TaxID=307507 RepID=A0A2V0NQF7_9CHLO|nr:hypothetical protein Rsub_02091 [Raphidocelis subcapitata]|eukprot:GBF89519.1 hypothetical protein Rsub_02091 [Raphidocelis subcapitata]
MKAVFALAFLAIIAAAQAQAGRYCHHSCYKGVECKKALAAKVGLLDMSKIPYKVEAQACNKADCDAIIRYSFATEKEWDTYQTMEKKDAKLVAAYTAAGLKSATPTGLMKNGTCATLKTFSARRLM